MGAAQSLHVGGDRIRALTRERLELLRDGRSALSRERLDEIDTQLPELLHRHRLIHHALLAVYTSIGILVLTMCVIALTATILAEWVGPLVYGVFLLSVLAVFVGVVLITMEIGTSRARRSNRETARVLAVGHRQEPRLGDPV